MKIIKFKLRKNYLFSKVMILFLDYPAVNILFVLPVIYLFTTP